MKNILFPTDFSKHSKMAMDAAIEIAKNTNAKIFVVNAFYVPALDINAVPSTSQELYTEEKLEVEKELEKICKTISLQKNSLGKFIETEYLAELNVPANEIVKAAEEKAIDLIVMGCENKNSFLDFMTSTSWAVFKEAKCNVLIIKEGTQFQPLKNILFAVENISQEIDRIKNVVEVAKIFNAKITVMHINHFANNINDLIETKENDNDAISYIDSIKEYVSYDNILYCPIFSDTVSEAITNAIKNNSCELLALVKQERGWFENLVHKSITKELFTNTNTPLLIVH